MMSIPGLRLYKNIIPTKMLQDFAFQELDTLINQYGKNKLQRKVAHFGYEYDYSIREPCSVVLNKTFNAPDWLQCLGDVFYRRGVINNEPNQIILNKYLPGEGIGAHRDHHPIFDNNIAILSLGSEYVMDFTNPREQPRSLLLNNGSLLVMSDDSRYFWKHEIKRRKSDVVGGVRIKRGERISVTFRKVNYEFCGK